MNKSNLLLYAVSARDIKLLSDFCVECGKPIKWGINVYLVGFEYYDYITRTNTDYEIYMCKKCFRSKIEDKPLKSLLNYIPLLRIKGKKMNLARNDYEPNHELMKPYNNAGVYNEHEYVKIVSNEILLKYNQRANKYNEVSFD